MFRTYDRVTANAHVTISSGTVMRSARVSIQAVAKLVHDSPALTFWSRLENKWSEMQVGRQGSYSIERLESLEHYCKTTSLVRVILVCVLTPIPAITVAVLLECLPLQHPSEGWAANWVFWIRWTLMLLAICFIGVSQLLTYVPGLDFTLFKRWLVSLGSTSVFVGTCILAAAVKGFPVPFMLQLGSVIMGLYLAVMVRLVFSKKEFGSDSKYRPYFRRFYRFLLAFIVLGGVYPIYRVIYDAAPLKIRGAMILALPLWKFTAKKLMVKAIRELEDFIPELVAFTVDFFSALFVSACMTTSGSAILSVMFIVSDVAQGLLEFHEVRMNAKVIMNILHRDPKSKRTNSFEATNLIAMILRVARNPRGFRVTRIENVRLRACLPHPLTEEQEMRLQTLQASGIFRSGTFTSSTGSRKRSIIRWLPSQFSTNASIYPEDTEASVRTASKDYSARSKRETAKKLVEQGLQLLFHCEYLALVEYVECVVPLIFVTYESILKQLPNAVYYPGGTDSWGMTAVMNLLAFSALEMGTFVLFIRFLQRKFAFSPLYQLAFVLETQVYLVQAKLLIEVVTLLQSKLAHFGGGYAANIDHKT